MCSEHWWIYQSLPTSLYMVGVILFAWYANCDLRTLVKFHTMSILNLKHSTSQQWTHACLFVLRLVRKSRVKHVVTVSRDHLPLHRDTAGGSRALPPVSSAGTRMTGCAVDGPVLTQVWKTSPGQRSSKYQQQDCQWGCVQAQTHKSHPIILFALKFWFSNC